MSELGRIDWTRRGRRRHRSMPRLRRLAVLASERDLRFWVLVSWLTLVFLLGGSSRADTFSLLFLRPLSVVVLAYALAGLTLTQIRNNRFLLGMAAALLALPLLQLVPLPPGLWHALPGRGIVAEIDQQAGLGAIWRPLSMAPEATRNAMWALLTPIAVIVLGIQLDRKQQARLLAPIIALGFLSAVIGVLQIAGDPKGPLYFYRISHNGLPIGLLANRNHQAALLASVPPMLAVWATIWQRRDQRPRSTRRWSQWLPPFLGALVLVPLILITGSRSGLVLGAVALLSLPLLVSDKLMPTKGGNGRARAGHGIGRAGWPFALGLVVLVILTATLGRALSLDRLAELDAGSDLRLRALPIVVSLARDYAPWGSGLGTFEQVYRLHEPDNLLAPSYMNHAHNDWLELVLTGGVPAVAVLAVGLSGLAYSLFRLVADRRRRGELSPHLARLGFVIIGILGLASISDYPLRAPSLACLAAVGVLWARPQRSQPNEEEEVADTDV